MTRCPDLLIPRIFAAIDDHRFDDLPAFYTPEVRADTVGRVAHYPHAFKYLLPGSKRPDAARSSDKYPPPSRPLERSHKRG
jgi:hypothetical protein